MILTIHYAIHSHPALKEPVSYIAGRSKIGRALTRSRDLL